MGASPCFDFFIVDLAPNLVVVEEFVGLESVEQERIDNGIVRQWVDIEILGMETVDYALR